MAKPAVTIVAGPTASGKTGRALELAQQVDGAIISADSRMVFAGLDIGAGKPTWEYRQLTHTPWITAHSVITSEVGSDLGPVYLIQGIDHYLLDLVPPETPFTLTDWLSRARGVLAHLEQERQPAIIVGGTGLYLKALLEGYQPPPTDPALRSQLEHLPDEELFEELQVIDPQTALRERANHRRLVRALEVYRLTGRPFSSPIGHRPLSAEIIRLELPRAELFERIDQRIKERLDQGMVEEVETLLAKGISADWLRGLGLEYRVLSEWLAEEQKNRGELTARLQQVIHAYARRQETFLRTQLIGS